MRKEIMISNKYLPPIQDENKVVKVRQILKSLGYDPANIKHQMYLTFDKNTGELEGIYSHITESQAKTYRIQHPDIIVLKQNKIRFIVEIDGSIHSKPSVQRRDAKRNETYAIAGLQYIILNEADLKLMKWDWDLYITQATRKIERELAER